MKGKLSSLYGFHEINSLYSLGEVGYGIYGVGKYRIGKRHYLPQHVIYRPCMIRILPFPDRVAEITFFFQSFSSKTHISHHCDASIINSNYFFPFSVKGLIKNFCMMNSTEVLNVILDRYNIYFHKVERESY